jgi:hypothetical protein
MTPLMKASARGHLGVVTILLTPGKREGSMKLKTKERPAAQVDLRSDVRCTSHPYPPAVPLAERTVAHSLWCRVVLLLFVSQDGTPLQHRPRSDACKRGPMPVTRCLYVCCLLLVCTGQAHPRCTSQRTTYGRPSCTLFLFPSVPPNCVDAQLEQHARAHKQGHGTVVSTLLTAGATVDIRCRDGETPLMRAAFNGHISCVEVLLSAGM